MFGWVCCWNSLLNSSVQSIVFSSKFWFGLFYVLYYFVELFILFLLNFLDFIKLFICVSCSSLNFFRTIILFFVGKSVDIYFLWSVTEHASFSSGGIMFPWLFVALCSCLHMEEALTSFRLYGLTLIRKNLPWSVGPCWSVLSPWVWLWRVRSGWVSGGTGCRGLCCLVGSSRWGLQHQ